MHTNTIGIKACYSLEQSGWKQKTAVRLVSPDLPSSTVSTLDAAVAATQRTDLTLTTPCLCAGLLPWRGLELRTPQIMALVLFSGCLLVGLVWWLWHVVAQGIDGTGIHGTFASPFEAFPR